MAVTNVTSPGYQPEPTTVKSIRGPGRQTLPDDKNAYGSPLFGVAAPLNLGFLTRRWLSDFGLDSLNSIEIANIARWSPLRLLTHLPDINPVIAYSFQMDVSLLVPPEGLPIVGGTYVDRDGKRIFEKTDEASLEIEALLDRQPREIGGLRGLQDTLVTTTLLSAMACTEIVAGPSGSGVRNIWPVDPLTITFKRAGRNSPVTAFQRQSSPDAGSTYQELRDETFIWQKFGGWVDDPFGRIPYGTSLPELLMDMSIVQDLRAALHNAPGSRYVAGFNFNEAYEQAKKLFGMNDPMKAKDYVTARFQAVVDYLSNKLADDNFVVDTNGTLTILPGANFQGIENALKFFEQRILWSCMKTPSLMGSGSSGSNASGEMYTGIQWQVYALMLETIRSVILAVCKAIFNAHFRLLGKLWIAQAEYERLRTADLLNEQNILAQKIANETRLRDEGYQTQDQASINLTKTGAVVPFDTPAKVPPAYERKTQPDQANQNPGQANNVSSTRQEQTAQRQTESQVKK